MPSKKILGLELLRGLCALLVACYHGLIWGEVSLYPSWGLYGVYVFFVISGAVLYQNYHGALTLGTPGPGELTVAGFLFKRFARLAPLMWACVFLQAVVRHNWVSDEEFLNLSFLFGFASPGLTSYLSGGWSIGIEFVLYALFPMLLAFTRDTRTMILTLVIFLVLRVAFVALLLRQGSFTANWALYTQPGAFLVFFFGGMLIAKVMPLVRMPLWILLAIGLACGIALFVFPGRSFEEVLLGGRGLVLTGLSIVIVAAFFWSPSSGFGAAVSQFFGDVSYGLYLLHPLVWAALHRYLPPMSSGSRIAIMISTAMIAAWLSLRFFERPVRAWILRWGERRAASGRPAERAA
jgi:peptidoglycan/LPS O-acetylase OafA/YrhL